MLSNFIISENSSEWPLKHSLFNNYKICSLTSSYPLVRSQVFVSLFSVFCESERTTNRFFIGLIIVPLGVVLPEIGITCESTAWF